jgi:hypothetical protein
VLIPSSRAFSSARRLPAAPARPFATRRGAALRPPGRDELAAENMALKRRLEAEAGNFAAFARGMSYSRGAERRAGPATGATPSPTSYRPPSPTTRTRPYRRMRDDHPLYFHGPSQAWILSRFDDVHAGADESPRASRRAAMPRQTEPLLGRTIIQLDGREHNLQRNLLIQPFRAASIQQAAGRR